MAEYSIDLTLGIYRRIYAGFRTGHRINAVSIGAEAWFWRLNAIADDYGNFMAEPTILRNEAAGRRKVSVKQAEAWLAELVPALVVLATIAGERFGHIVGFEKLQPAGKNGRRIRKVPVHPGESGGIQNNPEVKKQTGQAHSHTQPHTHSDTHSHSQPEGGESNGSCLHPVGSGGSGKAWTTPALTMALIESGINKATAQRLGSYASKFDGFDVIGEFRRLSDTPSVSSPTGALVKLMAQHAGIEMDQRKLAGALQDVVNQRRGDKR